MSPINPIKIRVDSSRTKELNEKVLSSLENRNEESEYELEQLRAKHNFKLEKIVKITLLIFFWAILLMILVIFGAYIYTVLACKENSQLSYLASIIISVGIGSISGAFVQRFLK